MGVPKFFRYISERYPCLSEIVREYQIPEFDNLYLDMNGIIHTCSHPDDSDPHFRITEERIFKDIFHYIEVLFQMIKPRKLFFMAVDGVAPRAKMNQQRGRRFRSAREALTLETKARERGETLPTEARFDSNCITPGTVFMARLHEQLKFFIVHKISTDKLWQNCKIILSGHETPGEGEHKIMDYIRYMRAQPGYDPNTRHCLYGLDADLIMLGLCTHEPHFCLLREEVKFGKKNTKRKNIPEQITFFLLHLSLMREYLELEFQPLKDDLVFDFDIEKIVDDWVLMGFLVGNDFIPNLPNMHITNGALPLLYNTYMKVLPRLGGYINEGGMLNLERFEIFMQELSSIDIENFSEKYADLKWFEAKTGRRLDGSENTNLKQLDIWEPEDDLLLDEPLEPIKANSDLAALIKATDDLLLEPTLEVQIKFEGEGDMEAGSDNSVSEEESLFNAEFIQHKKDYYLNKLEYETVTPEVLRSQAEEYVRAIQWNLHYYYNGVCSWSWFYPHHYSPYVSDIKGFSDFKFSFELGTPFKPYEQLLAVLPSASKILLPEPYQELMTAEDSPIKDYYPEDFKTDLNGKRQDWEAVVLIPFIDENVLLEAMEPCNEMLTLEEKSRNTHRPMLVYDYTPDDLGYYAAPEYFPSVKHSHADCELVHIEDIRIPREKLVKGAYPGAKFDVFYPGFPTMKHLNYVGSLEKAKVKVFEQASRGDNMILRIIDDIDETNEMNLVRELLGKTVHVGWPHLVEALVVSISTRQHRYHSTGEKGQYNVEENKGNLSSHWNAEKQGITEYYQNRLGVDVGLTNILIHVKIIIGRKYIFSPRGRINLEKQWAEITSAYPLQTIVCNIKAYEEEFVAYKDIHEVFPRGSSCFILCQPGYGAMVEILDSSDSLKEGRVKVSCKNIEEPDFTPAFEEEKNIRVRYMNLHHACATLDISKGLFSRVTGCIFITPGSHSDTQTEDVKRVNIGLNLKFNKRNEEVPGYSKRDNGLWYYSHKAVDLVRSYMEQFPEVFSYLNCNIGNDIFFEEDIFPDGNSKDTLRQITAWIKDQPFYSVERQICGSQTLDPEIVKVIEEIVDEYNEGDVKAKQTVLRVKPHLLYKAELQMGNLMPDPAATFYLYDRIVNVRDGYTVPFGLKGTIIGIHKPNTGNEDEILYDIVFDKEFPGGYSLNCSDNRGYRMPRPAIINISHGQRIYEQKKRKNGQLPYPQGQQNFVNLKNPAAFSHSSPNYPGQLQPQNSMYGNWGYGSNYPISPVSAPISNQYNYNSNGYSPRVYNNSYKANNPGPNTFVPYNKTNSFSNHVPSLSYGAPQTQKNLNYNMSHNLPQNTTRNMTEEKRNLHTAIDKDAIELRPSIPASNNLRTGQAQSQFPGYDSDMLKKVLKINENANGSNLNTPDSQIEKKGNSTPLSIDDIFAHARNKEQQNHRQHQPSNIFNTALLQKDFQSRGLGCPRYQYIEVNNKIMAKIVLPNGKEVVSNVSKSREEAAENVATKTLAILKNTNIETKPPEPPKAWQNSSPQFIRGQSPQKQWPNWRERNVPSTTKQENWRRQDKGKLNLNEVHKHLNILPSSNKSSDYTKADVSKKSSNTASAKNAFVPLQAVKQQHKQRNALSTTNEEEISSKQNSMTYESTKTENEAGKESIAKKSEDSTTKFPVKPRRERKIRIAANFPKLMTMNEN